jgi:hypothetical protein
MLLEPVTRQAVYNILRDAYQQGNPLILFETYRSRERQALLFAEGKSQLRDVGAHHYGLAADLVRAVDGMPSWEGDYTFLAELAQKYGLVSGSNWGDIGGARVRFVDATHVQRVTIPDQERLFAGEWYPDENYSVA